MYRFQQMIKMPTEKPNQSDSRPKCTKRPFKSPNSFKSTQNNSKGLSHQKEMVRKKPLDPKKLMEEYGKWK